MVRVWIRPRLISLVAAATGVVSQGSAFRVWFEFRSVAQDGPQVVRLLHLPYEQGVVLFACMASVVTTVPSSGSGASSGLVAHLVRLPGLRDPVLADHDPRDVGDRGEQVHLLVPAGLGALAFLSRRPRRPGVRERARDPRRRPDPATGAAGAAGTSRPPAPHGISPRPAARLPLLPPFLFSPLLLRAVRGVRGRDRGIERSGSHGRGQRGLELVRVQQSRQPARHRRGRRRPQPGPRAGPAAVRGQHLLVPARRRLRDRQRPAQRGRRARRHHRHQRRQRMPLPPRLARVSQPAFQRLPQGHRIKHRPGRQVAADAVSKP